MTTMSVILLLLVQIIQIFCFKQSIPLEPEIGPRGMPHNKTTSCREFGKFARFNPFSVVGFHWFTFYYWATVKPAMSYKFRVPTARDTHYLHYLLDGRVADNFNWSARMLLQIDQFDNTTSLMVEVGDRGQYHMYCFEDLVDMPIGSYIAPHNIRIKQVENDRYLGVMICKAHTAFVLSKIEEVPPKEKLQEEAAKLGYRGRKGKSYLYQGHGFMPVSEADEADYWRNFYAHNPVMFHGLT